MRNPTLRQVVARLCENPDWSEQLSPFQIAEIERRMKKCIPCVIAQVGTCGHMAERRREQRVDEMHISTVTTRILGVYEVLMRGNPNPIPACFTPIEVKLLRAFWAAGLSPHTQYQIGPFTADFAFPERRTIVEADGAAYHDADRDARRDAYLRKEGWRVVRFSGSQIMFNADVLVDHIYDQVRAA